MAELDTSAVVRVPSLNLDPPRPRRFTPNMPAQSNRYAPARIDFSALANLPEQFAAGQKWRQERDMQNALAGGLPKMVPDDFGIDRMLATHLAGVNVTKH